VESPRNQWDEKVEFFSLKCLRRLTASSSTVAKQFLDLKMLTALGQVFVEDVRIKNDREAKMVISA
jgi:hypothetical protein